MTTAEPIWLPLGFLEWLPISQAAALAMFTLLQEDLPTVGGALLAAAGKLSWTTAFLGCFLGIWLGDAMLYGVARIGGRPLLRRPWLVKFCNPAAVARSEAWFARRGTWLLLSSRFVPGTRLPTYLAAGLLRLPFGRFLAVTGLAVALWTVGIFGLARVAGPELLGWLEQWNLGGWTFALAGLALVAGVQLARAASQRSLWLRLHGRIGRWTHWEFWPPWLFYTPVVLNYLRLSARHRSLTVPTLANPGIFAGGFVGESKMATLRELHRTSPDFTAEAHSLEAGQPTQRLATLHQLLRQHDFTFPFILKPDMGQRGIGVKLIRTADQAEAYLRQTDAALVLQRYAPGPQEAGIFYYQFPGEPQGRIFAITEKVFPMLTGDGERSVEQLIWHDPRARFMAGKYLERLEARRKEVLPAGATLRLVEAGNHAQGCIFRDGRHLWSEELEQCLTGISQRLQGFFIGRYDIRYATAAELRRGMNFQIIELNGATSEATSIYDARNSIWTAYRTLFRQWDLVFTIGAANRDRGHVPTKLSLVWQKWRENSRLAATYPGAD